DILWRDGNGSTILWELNGDGRSHYWPEVTSYYNLGTVAPGWQIQDTGDFDGDAKSGDILWRNDNGTTVLWEMDGGSKKADVNLNAIPTEWSVQGIGDFNGDGNSDILWRRADGHTVLWEVNGGSKMVGVKLRTI